MYDVEISIAQGENAEVFGLAVFVSPFQSREEAEEYAKRIKEFLEEEAKGSLKRIQ